MTQHVGARRNGIWTGSVRGFKEGQPFPHCTTSKKFLGAKIFQLVVLWQCRANQGPKDYFCSWQKSQYVYGLCQRWGAKSEQMWHPPLQFTGINPNLQSTENASQSATKCKKKNEVRAGRCWCTMHHARFCAEEMHIHQRMVQRSSSDLSTLPPAPLLLNDPLLPKVARSLFVN